MNRFCSNILTGTLLKMTVQSCARRPAFFTVAKATRTLEYKAEKLTSTSTPHKNIRCLFRGSSKKKTIWVKFKEIKTGPQGNHIIHFQSSCRWKQRTLISRQVYRKPTSFLPSSNKSRGELSSLSTTDELKGKKNLLWLLQFCKWSMKLTVVFLPADISQIQFPGVSSSQDWVCQGARLLQGVSDLHDLLAPD